MVTLKGFAIIPWADATCNGTAWQPQKGGTLPPLTSFLLLHRYLPGGQVHLHASTWPVNQQDAGHFFSKLQVPVGLGIYAQIFILRIAGSKVDKF